MREVLVCRTPHYHSNAVPHIKIPCNVQAGKGRTFAKMATICLCHVHSVAGTITHICILKRKASPMFYSQRKNTSLQCHCARSTMIQLLLRHLSQLDGCSCAGLIDGDRSSIKVIDLSIYVLVLKMSRSCLSVKVTFGNALVSSRIGAHEADRCNAQRQ